ncbi:MAG TPA: neutral zinc metallopeptidase [Bacteroidales bacterium]|nr:neutral zinc metallopeptidase [Bacteroidales bacterium]
MKWKGRMGSGNIEDRRGMSRRGMVAGGGIGTIIMVILVLLFGGDPSQLLNMGGGDTQTEQVTTTPEEDEMAQFVSVVLKDTETVWGKIFEESGSSYRQPTLVLFRDQVESACGMASSASGPFYCPSDQKLYVDLSFMDQLRTKLGAQGDFAIAYVIAHEVGHHVQNMLGILAKADNQKSQVNERRANEISVKVELQADFLAGMWAHYAGEMLNTLEAGDIDEAMNAAAAVGDDVLQRKYQGRVVPDSFTHGSAEQRKQWFRRGYQTGDFKQGDTFSADLE